MTSEESSSACATLIRSASIHKLALSLPKLHMNSPRRRLFSRVHSRPRHTSTASDLAYRSLTFEIGYLPIGSSFAEGMHSKVRLVRDIYGVWSGRALIGAQDWVGGLGRSMDGAILSILSAPSLSPARLSRLFSVCNCTETTITGMHFVTQVVLASLLPATLVLSPVLQSALCIATYNLQADLNGNPLISASLSPIQQPGGAEHRYLCNKFVVLGGPAADRERGEDVMLAMHLFWFAWGPFSSRY